MKNLRWTLLAALIMAAPQVAHAQAPGAPTSTTTTTTTQDAGAITNAAPASTTTSSTTVTQGIAPSTAVVPEDTTMTETETTTMPDTGGAPILMSLTGLALATAAFGLRRKVTA